MYRNYFIFIIQALDAEIVVVVDGSNEFGNSFMTRVSYLASEI